jgi:hypothetical protein
LLDAVGLVSHDLRLRFTCHDCQNSFLAEEGGWDHGELAEPCSIIFHREKALAGAMVPFMVHLNGELIGTVANGAAIEFQTLARSNTVVVTDHNFAAIKGGVHTFEATDGGTAVFRFKKGQLSRT